MSKMQKSKLTFFDSEEKLKTIFDHASDAIIYVDRNGALLEVNYKFLEMFGYLVEEAIGKQIGDLDFIRDKDKLKVAEYFHTVFSGKPSALFTVKAIRKDKTEILIEINANPIEKKHDITGAIVTIRDITNRRLFDSLLKEKDVLLANAQQVAKLGTWYMDFKTNQLTCSEELYKTFQIENHDDLDPDRFVNLIHPDDRDMVNNAASHAINEIGHYNVEFRIKLPDGEIRYLRASGEILQDETGNKTGIIGTAIDISDLKKTEVKLRESEEKFRKIFENANVGIIYFGMDGTFKDINLKHEEIFGYKREELLGKRYDAHRFVNDEDLKRCINLYKEAAAGKPARVIEYEGIRKDKSKVFVETNIQLIKEGDETVGLVNILQDITDRKKLEKKLIASYESLRQSKYVTIMGLAKLAEYRDFETGKHLERIREYVKILTTGLKTLPKYADYITDDYIEDIYNSSILHDIGKVSTPDSILLKPGKLTPAEFEIMKQHSVVGGDALSAAEAQIDGQSFLALGKEIAYSHHEKWDGSGYPKGLKGEEISLSARIVALADAYDAMTSNRPYKTAVSHEKSKQIIIEDSGTHFDPQLVDIFIKYENAFNVIRKKLIDTL